MQTSEVGIDMLKGREKLRLEAYDDATGKSVQSWKAVQGVVTIGFGHTGDDVYPGMKITEEEAEDLFEGDIAWAEDAVNRYVKVELSQSQFDALVNFTFNVGAEEFRTSTLLRLLNKGKYGAVPEQMARWNKTTINNKLVQSAGLAKRRAEEAALWASDDASSHSETPAPVKEDRGESTGLGVSGLGAIGTALSEGAAHIQGLTQYSDILLYAFVALTVGGVAFTIYARIRKARRE